MGIINLTPDSFYDGGTLNSLSDLLKRAEKHLTEGATFLDLGAYSSRPGAENISANEELKRLLGPVNTVRKEFPGAFISIDTFRSEVALAALDSGADLINDISGGNFDPELPKVAAHNNAPYICMHMRGNPQNMQKNLTEEKVMPDLLKFFSFRIKELQNLGIKDVIIDPGFGFGKTLVQNYEIVDHLADLEIFRCPILIGVSHKSMIRTKYGESPENTLRGTIEVHRELLKNGAGILRVHDVNEAVELLG